jgi:hypothetical protein
MKEAAIPAAINAVINGLIAYDEFSSLASVPLTVDAISSSEATVGSNAALIALTLSVILTCITSALARRAAAARAPHAARAPLFPGVLRLAVEHALVLFGATVVVAVLWQRSVGSVSVSPLVAAMMLALFAAAATVFVHVRTTRALLAEGAARRSSG